MSKDILKKVRQIEIRTKNLVNDFFGGDYHSNFKGRGMTFSEVREYQAGDDIRFIDWNVTARTGKPYIKIFEEERELTVLLLIDVSSSGVFGSKSSLKIDLGIEIASVLGFSAIKNNDKVGLVLFNDDIAKYIPPKKGKSHILRLISDFVDDNFWSELKYLNFKHDLIGIQIYDSFEEEFPNLGLVEVHDSESDEKVWIDTSRKKNRKDFSKYFKKNLKEFSQKCKNIGFDLIQIGTNQDYIKTLTYFFKKRAKRI